MSKNIFTIQKAPESRRETTRWYAYGIIARYVDIPESKWTVLQWCQNAVTAKKALSKFVNMNKNNPKNVEIEIAPTLKIN